MKQYRDIALKIAIEAHKNQKDKAGHDFINHPITVAEIIERDLYNEVKSIALKENRNICELIDLLIATAYLHDTLEDTDCTAKYLIENQISTEIVDLVIILTRPKFPKTYMDYIYEISKNNLATIVRLADLKHNLDVTRFENFKHSNSSLVTRYEKAYKFLINNL